MSVHVPTVVPAAIDPGPFSDRELFALAGFLARYSGLTYEAYALDLRQYASYCAQHRLALFDARRAHIETFARHLEAAGKARATIARRLCTVTCFYRYAEQEGLIATSPAVHVRRPRLDYESHATGLDRNELGAMLVIAGLASPRDHALIALLALNGLRVSEALGADGANGTGPRRHHRQPQRCQRVRRQCRRSARLDVHALAVLGEPRHRHAVAEVASDRRYRRCPLTRDRFARRQERVTPKTPPNVAAGNTPVEIAVTASGKNAYVTNISDNTISQYNIDLRTGTLSPETPAKIATGVAPDGLAVRPPP